MLGLFLAVLLALTFVGTVLAVSIAAGRLALGALLAVLTTSLGLLLLAALRLLLTALCSSDVCSSDLKPWHASRTGRPASSGSTPSWLCRTYCPVR